MLGLARRAEIFISFLVALVLCTWICPAEARQRCSVLATRDVRAVEVPDAVMKKGRANYGPVTQVRVNKKSGQMIFCAHGSNCYDGSAFEFTSPCRLSPSTIKDDDEFFFDTE